MNTSAWEIILDLQSKNNLPENIWIYIILKIKPLVVKKLLLAPFLLSSLFSFGGELKSHPDSLYEIPNTKLDISDPKKLNNNNSKQYFLRANVFELGGSEKRSYYRNISSHEDIPFSDLSACLRAKKTIKDFVLRAHKNVGDRRIKFYGFCSPGEKNTISKYEIPEYYKFQLDWVELVDDLDRYPEIQFPNFPTHFLDKSSCEINGRRTTTQVRGMNIKSILFDNIKLRSRYVCIKTSTL